MTYNYQDMEEKVRRETRKAIRETLAEFERMAKKQQEERAAEVFNVRFMATTASFYPSSGNIGFGRIMPIVEGRDEFSPVPDTVLVPQQLKEAAEKILNPKPRKPSAIPPEKDELDVTTDYPFM